MTPGGECSSPCENFRSLASAFVVEHVDLMVVVARAGDGCGRKGGFDALYGSMTRWMFRWTVLRVKA